MIKSNKTIKILSFFVMAFAFIFTPLGMGKVFAATGGFFDKQLLPRWDGGPSSMIQTDGSNGTYSNVRYGAESYWYRFTEKVTIDKIFWHGGGYVGLKFFSDQNHTTLIKSLDIRTMPQDSWVDIVDVPNVQSIAPYTTDGYDAYVGELDFKLVTPIVHTEITSLMWTSSFNSIYLSWDSINGNAHAISYKIFKNGTLIKTLDKSINTFTDTNVSENTTYNYKITATYDDGFETSGTSVMASAIKNHIEISNLTVVSNSFDTSNLAWDLPNSPYLVGFNIYRNNKLIKTLDRSDNSFKDTELTEKTTYNYKVTALYDDGAETDGVTKSITTSLDPVVKNVKDAKAIPVAFNRINISWALPDQTSLHHVNIYRGKKDQESGFFQSLFGLVTNAAEEPTKIFETNGTYFNDLTVQPETTYEYNLTTETTDGRESDGVTVEATTPGEPKPILKDDGFSIDPQTGDYTFKWIEPTLGKVRVLIDGTQYKEVEASLKQITIPSNDMKYDVFGTPKVSLVPISEFGTIGEKEYPAGKTILENVQLPFHSSDLLTTIMGILGLIAPIILLTLAIYYFKPIKRVIVNVAVKIKERGART